MYLLHGLECWKSYGDSSMQLGSTFKESMHASCDKKDNKMLKKIRKRSTLMTFKIKTYMKCIYYALIYNDLFYVKLCKVKLST